MRAWRAVYSRGNTARQRQLLIARCVFPGSGEDQFRIRIGDKATEGTVYGNMPGVLKFHDALPQLQIPPPDKV